MSKFLTDLEMKLIDEFGGIYQLTAPLIYDSDLLGTLVTVPRDFRTDLASVPRLPLAYMLLGDKGRRAAVVHDFAYSGGISVTRDVADELLAEALRAEGYGMATVWAMYLGVRIGGAPHFNAPNLPQEAHVAARMEAP